jgi:hypothetical protein
MLDHVIACVAAGPLLTLLLLAHAAYKLYIDSTHTDRIDGQAVLVQQQWQRSTKLIVNKQL